jgi:hypothetical protein
MTDEEIENLKEALYHDWLNGGLPIGVVRLDVSAIGMHVSLMPEIDAPQT